MSIPNPGSTPQEWQPKHPSQAEGEDPDHPDAHDDPPLQPHPSQAEGEDDDDA